MFFISGNEIYLQDVWAQVLQTVKNTALVEEIVFDTYFIDSKLYSLEDKVGIVTTDNFITVKVLNENAKQLANILSQISNKDIAVCQVILEKDLHIFTETDTVETTEFKQKEPSLIKKTLVLNPEYTFENFIVGASNIESQKAAVAASVNPGGFYNPLFIYGGPGLGKTHLLQSIANYLSNKNPKTKILMMSSSDFVDGVCDPGVNLDKYKKELVSYDVFLVDDIQFLADKKKSVEIFFHVFNELVNDKKQIVLTSDCAPYEIRGLESRLVSRFASGLQVGVSPPEFETAVRIIKNKIERRTIGLDIDDDVIDYIAANFSSDVRLLEGTINRLIFNLVQSSENEKIDLAFALKYLKDTTQNYGQITIKTIKAAVNDFYGLGKGQLEGKARTGNVALARHIAIYLCRKHLDLPFKTIGGAFGNRDHSTIMHSCDKIEKKMKSDKNYRLAVSKIEERFVSHR